MKPLSHLLFVMIFLTNAPAQNRVQEAWVRHYTSGLIMSGDCAREIAVYDIGNVYVTGVSGMGNQAFGRDADSTLWRFSECHCR